MSWLRSKNAKPDFTSLQIQTSTSTLPIPIIWGSNKVSPNVIWYSNFRTQTSGGGGGKGGMFGGGASTNSYTADLIMALGEGPIDGIGYIWRDQSTYTLADLGLSLFNGATPQSSWGYLIAADANEALSYQGTAYVAAASYQLGDAASVGNHNFEVFGIDSGSGTNGIDADPAYVIFDFLTNPQYGAGFAPASINAGSLFGVSGDASLQTYCRSMRIAFSPCLTTQEQASSILSRWLQLLNCAAVWSQGELKFIPYGDVTIPAGATTNVVQSAVPQPSTTSAGSSPPPTIVVCAPSLFSSDLGVTYTFTGASLSFIGASAPTSAGFYGVSPNGAYLFSTSDEGQAITITYVQGNANAYAPNTTPIYALTDSDFLHDRDSTDPVRVSRSDPFSLPNVIRLDVLSRNNQYAGTIVEARDQSQIELYGLRVGTAVQAHEICDDVTVAPIVAQAVLQRQLYVRTHYQFKLGVEYCLLDPMDIVAITDSGLGLNQYPVRITSIEEDDAGNLAVEAEELTVGISTPVLYPHRAVQGYQPNRAYPADPINPSPLIYEPPPQLSGDTSQIWLGASGGTSGVADSNWGGCNVWISLDNVTYSEFGTINQPLREGSLSAAFAEGAPWDGANILSVNLTESAATLSGASMAER